MLLKLKTNVCGLLEICSFPAKILRLFLWKEWWPGQWFDIVDLLVQICQVSAGKDLCSWLMNLYIYFILVAGVRKRSAAMNAGAKKCVLKEWRIQSWILHFRTFFFFGSFSPLFFQMNIAFSKRLMWRNSNVPNPD